MASIAFAGSFASAYDFELGNKVKIDGSGQGTMLKKNKQHHEVILGGTGV